MSNETRSGGSMAATVDKVIVPQISKLNSGTNSWIQLGDDFDAAIRRAAESAAREIYIDQYGELVDHPNWLHTDLIERHVRRELGL